MGFSDSEFWKLTPRKILLVYNEHCIFNGWKEKPKEDVYIDELDWL